MEMTGLIRNEWIKLRGRPATLVTVGGYALVSLLEYGSRVHGGSSALSLPGGWRIILTSGPQLTAFAGSVLLILLVAEEFDWRTARQNVIDGLSREEWLAGKILLIPVLLAVFLTVRVCLGLVFALSLGGMAPASFAVDPAHIRALGGVALGFAGYTSLGLAIAVAVRGTGAATGVLFLYMLLVEQVLTTVLVQISSSFRGVVSHVPLRVFDAAMRYRQWDPGLPAAPGASVAGDGLAPGVWETSHLLVAALAWIVVLLGGSLLVFRRRDL